MTVATASSSGRTSARWWAPRAGDGPPPGHPGDRSYPACAAFGGVEQSTLDRPRGPVARARPGTGPHRGLATRALYRPKPLRPLLRPGQKACPTFGCIVNGPFANFTVTSECDRLMYPLVGVR